VCSMFCPSETTDSHPGCCLMQFVLLVCAQNLGADDDSPSPTMAAPLTHLPDAKAWLHSAAAAPSNADTVPPAIRGRGGSRVKTISVAALAPDSSRRRSPRAAYPAVAVDAGPSAEGGSKKGQKRSCIEVKAMVPVTGGERGRGSRNKRINLVSPELRPGSVGAGGGDESFPDSTVADERRRIPSRLLPWGCTTCTFENKVSLAAQTRKSGGGGG
jgi:hypothetical protein